MKIIKVPKGKSFRSRLIKLGACYTAVDWVGRKSLRTAWRQCPNGDWMLWLAAAAGIDRRMLVYAACQCARLSLENVPKGENRPLKAIETSEAWCRGEASPEEVLVAVLAAQAAAKAAFAAATTATHTAHVAATTVHEVETYKAAYTAHAAANAAFAAEAAATTAYAASDAARAAAYTAQAAAYTAHAAAYTAHGASSTAYAASDAAALSQCADIVRRIIPRDMVAEALEEIHEVD